MRAFSSVKPTSAVDFAQMPCAMLSICLSAALLRPSIRGVPEMLEKWSASC